MLIHKFASHLSPIMISLNKRAEKFIVGLTNELEIIINIEK